MYLESAKSFDLDRLLVSRFRRETTSRLDTRIQQRSTVVTGRILFEYYPVPLRMGVTDGRSQLLAALEESLCRDSDIEFAVVFGSQITGNARPSSDLDIAVKFTDGLSSHERFRKRCTLSGNLQQEDAPFVDVADIDELPLEVAYDAVHGDILCGEELAFREFKSDIQAAFEDRRSDISQHQRNVIDRIAEDGLRG